MIISKLLKINLLFIQLKVHIDLSTILSSFLCIDKIVD